MAAVVPNSVGWYILEGFPWWPVYICDVTKLRPTLHLLGSGHQKILKKARDFPVDFIVVYYFGSHDLYVDCLCAYAVDTCDAFHLFCECEWVETTQCN